MTNKNFGGGKERKRFVFWEGICYTGGREQDERQVYEVRRIL